MCGIIGQLAFGEFNEEKEKVRQESMIFLGSELLQMTQERGKDATGVSLLLDDGNYYGLKMGITALDFISRYGKNDKEYGGFVKVWRKSKKVGKVFLGHCRNTTKGCSLDNLNNHPIIVDEVIGVHNGTVQNDSIVFRKLGRKRIGAVDSEAIFALLHHFTKNGTEPLTTEILKEVTAKLTGTYAVLSYSGNNPYQACAFRDRKPIEMALIRPLKLLLCASEKRFIETAVFRYNKYINLYITTAEFPTLKDEDVVYKTLQDDSGVVFDLRTEVTKNTEITELYNWEKMPRVKEWSTEHSYNDNRKYGVASVNNSNAAGVKKTTTTDDDKDDDTPSYSEDKKGGKARIWMSSLKGYVPEGSDELKNMKKLGNVEVDIDAGKTKEITKPSEKTSTNDKTANGKFALETVGATVIDKDSDTDVSPQIKEIEVKKKYGVEQEPLTGDATVTTSNASSVEIDASVDPEAIEASEEIAKQMEQYETMDEVIVDLEIKDVTTLQQIPIVSLVNRIHKFVLKKGAYLGYLRRKKEKGATPKDTSLNKKKTAAEDNVRAMKAIAIMLLRILKVTSKKIDNDVINKIVAEALENREEISKEKIDKLFTEGDSRNYEVIREIKKAVAEKENR